MTRESRSVILGNAGMNRRQRTGLTQVDLAKLVDIEQHSLSRMEKGLISPKMSSLKQLADIPECSVADLFGQTDSPTFAKTMKLFYLMEYLPSEMQEVMVE